MPVITVSLISGTIVTAQGEPRTTTKVQFVPLNTPYVVGSDIVSTTNEQIITDINGSFSLNLAYGSYRVLVEGSDSFNICVPADGLPHNIIEILCSPMPVVSVGGGPLVVDVGALFATLQSTATVGFTRKGDPDATRTRIAVIGSYGKDGTAEGKVAALVKAWGPDDIIAAGDNNYPTGQASTIDDNVGKYYFQFIKPYLGGYGAGATDRNHFWPVPGEADWGAVIGLGASIQPYKDYFPAAVWNPTLYYKQTIGPCDVFFIDSDKNEPAGFSATSTQALWLQAGLAASTAKWKVVVFHHTPYASVSGYIDNWMNTWNFSLWGANVVITGHAKIYERLTLSGVTYLNVGTGGQTLEAVAPPVTGSQFRYAADWGAALIEANDYSLRMRFCDTTGFEQDSFELLAKDTNKIAAYVKYNRDAGLLVGPNGLEVDFLNMGFIKSLFVEAITKWANTIGVAGNYVYLAYASDNAGTGFTMTFNPSLNWIAIKISAHPINSPSASDFAGLWHNYGGGNASDYKNIIVLDRNFASLASAGVAAYGTAQGAYDQAKTLVAGGAPKVFILVGQGTATDFGDVILTADYESKIEWTGRGPNISQIGRIGIVNTGVACWAISTIYARDIRIQSLIAAPSGTVSSVGKDIGVQGNENTTVDTIDTRGGTGALGGNIIAKGVKFTTILTSSYPVTVGHSNVLLDTCVGGDVTTKGGTVELFSSQISAIDTSYSDYDGAHASGQGGDVTIVSSTCTDITTSGLAWTGGPGPNSRTPMPSGNVSIITFSNIQDIDTSSTNGNGGSVTISDSVCDAINTSSNGNVLTQPSSAQSAGFVSLRNATTTDITGTANKGTGATVIANFTNVGGDVNVSSTLNFGGAVQFISVPIGGNIVSTGAVGGNVIILDSSLGNITASTAAGTGGSVVVRRSSVGDVDVSTSSDPSGASGSIELTDSTANSVSTYNADTTGTVNAGKITLIRSHPGTLSADSASGIARHGVLIFNDVVFESQIACLRSGSEIRNSTLRMLSVGEVIADVTDEAGAPLIIRSTLIANGVAKTIACPSNPGNVHVRVGHSLIKIAIGTDVVNDYGTPYNIIDSALV